MLFIVLLVTSLLDYLALKYGPPPLLVAALAGRVHYTLAFVALAWQLNHWNLLGFHT